MYGGISWGLFQTRRVKLRADINNIFEDILPILKIVNFVISSCIFLFFGAAMYLSRSFLSLEKLCEKIWNFRWHTFSDSLRRMKLCQKFLESSPTKLNFSTLLRVIYIYALSSDLKFHSVVNFWIKILFGHQNVSITFREICLTNITMRQMNLLRIWPKFARHNQ